jgi:hypothetical protein
MSAVSRTQQRPNTKPPKKRSALYVALYMQDRAIPAAQNVVLAGYVTPADAKRMKEHPGNGVELRDKGVERADFGQVFGEPPDFNPTHMVFLKKKTPQEHKAEGGVGGLGWSLQDFLANFPILIDLESLRQANTALSFVDQADPDLRLLPSLLHYLFTGEIKPLVPKKPKAVYCAFHSQDASLKKLAADLLKDLKFEGAPAPAKDKVTLYFMLVNGPRTKLKLGNAGKQNLDALMPQSKSVVIVAILFGAEASFTVDAVDWFTPPPPVALMLATRDDVFYNKDPKKTNQAARDNVIMKAVVS